MNNNDFKSKILNILNNTNKIEKITIYDYTHYEPRFSTNGGCYWYSYEFRNIGGKKFTLKYDTSAYGFDYCNNCGRFTRHEEWEECEPEVIDFYDILKDIINYYDNKNFVIEIEYNDGKTENI